jgi:hypothetical protein
MTTRLALLRQTFDTFGTVTLSGHDGNMVICALEFLAAGKTDVARGCLGVLLQDAVDRPRACRPGAEADGPKEEARTQPATPGVGPVAGEEAPGIPGPRVPPLGFA